VAQLALHTMSGHVCEAGNDPRKQESCVRCGRLIPPPPPPAPVLDLCDPAFETEATVTAARQAGVDGRSLDAFANARRHPGPVTNHPTRDLSLDTYEELADARNYLVWKLEQHRHLDTLTVERQWHLMQSLGAVAVAWHHLAQADH
jgi:hypothetical protein